MLHPVFAIHSLISFPVPSCPSLPHPRHTPHRETQREREMAITSAMLGAIRLIPSPNSRPNSNSNSSSQSPVKAQKCTQIVPKSVANRLHPVVPLSVSVAIPSIGFFLSPEVSVSLFNKGFYLLVLSFHIWRDFWIDIPCYCGLSEIVVRFMNYAYFYLIVQILHQEPLLKIWNSTNCCFT